MNKILVFGGNGFIGSTIVKYLKYNKLKALYPTKKECNLLDIEKTKEYLKKLNEKDIKIVFCSAITRSKDNSPESMQANIKIVSNFIRCTKLLSISSLIYISSVDVYGSDQKNILNEHTILSPDNYYGISKTCSEYLLKESAENYPLTILRLPGVYGKNDGGLSTIGAFYRKIIKKTSINLVCRGNQLRDYVFVSDISRIVWHFLKNPCHDTFNVSTGKSLKIIEIINLISDNLGIKPIIKYADNCSEKKDMIISNEKLCNYLNYNPFLMIEDGIKEYINDQKIT